MDAPTATAPSDTAGDGGRMNMRDLHSTTLSTDVSNDNNAVERDRTGSNASVGPRRASVTMAPQHSTNGSRVGYSTRVRKPRPDSNSSAASSRLLDPRGSVLSRLSSIGGNGGLRDTFFGTKRDDPLELSTNQEFDLTVIDESGGLEENIVGQILLPDIGSFSSWSPEGYAVVAVGAVTVLITGILALVFEQLDGYSINPGFVFGSLQTLLLCAVVFITYHGVQMFQAHPNPLILYKCVIDMALALRFLLEPLLQDWGVYTPGVDHSCQYLSAVTQFLYLSSDCWYFALIVDLYLSLTNPFTSVAADRRKYKIAIYTVSAISALCIATINGAHGFADGKYCWTSRGKKEERNFWRLNVASWMLFYDWMILFYLSGVAVLVFCAKRLRSGLRDTLQTRRDMLRNGTISILSFTVYWTIVFAWYAISFHTRTKYVRGEIPPSKIFRAFTYTLSGRGAVDYFVWFMLNRPSQIRQHWLVFSAESADKKFSAQLNTALQQELIYFTIEGMTRAIQMADDELVFTRDRSPSHLYQPGHHHESSRGGGGGALGMMISDVPVLGDDVSSRGGDGASDGKSTSSAVLDSPTTATGDKKRRKHATKGDTFDIPRMPAAAAAAAAAAASRESGNKHPLHPAQALSPVPEPQAASPPMWSRKKSAASSYNHIRFTPYKPDVFAELRSAFGISAADFRTSFETSTKPNISEGASGAFLFFSGDRRFIVKSMAETECRFLIQIADEYTDYLIAHPASLITKFLGCFKITLYEKKFYFVVMENLFDVAEQIHHRFDIKGSWVSRSYKRPRRGVKVKCRHCSMLFKVGAKKALLQCPNVVGIHEPNVVLKDNDLRTRMRIGRDAGRELYEQLRDDSLFLCRLGIMDYSLLLGVVDIEFLVDHNKQHSRRNTVTSTTSGSRDNLTNVSFMSVDSTLSMAPAATADLNEIALRDGVTGLEQLEDVAAARDRMDSDQTTADRSTHSVLTPAASTHQQQSQVHRYDDHHRSNNNDTNQLVVSRLSGAQHRRRAKHTMRRSKRIFGPAHYYIGVIDILQTWTLQKRLERMWKVWFQRRDPDGLSAIEPVAYQRRFEAKLREIIALPKDYVAKLTREHERSFPSMHHSMDVSVGPSASAATTAAMPIRSGQAQAPGGSSGRMHQDGTGLGAQGRNDDSLVLDASAVDRDARIVTGGRSDGRNNTQAANGVTVGGRTDGSSNNNNNALRHISSDDITSSDNSSHTNSSVVGDGDDLEQAQRNPEPILLRFSHMLVGSSTRSNITTVSSSQRDIV